MPRIMLLVFASLALIAVSGLEASAQAPAYVGTWGQNQAQCRVDQSLEGAPMIMKRDRYDQHETHCVFTSVRKQGARWAVRSRCDVQGDRQNANFTLSVTDDRLTMRDERGARTFQRCR